MSSRQPWMPQRSKYRNRRVKVDGITFDSVAEANYYGQLKLRVAAGDIKRFHRQVIFDLAGVTYRCDFQVIHNDGTVEYIDVKGAMTKAYIRSKKQVLAMYGVEIREVQA
jgi:hypothetical protein